MESSSETIPKIPKYSTDRTDYREIVVNEPESNFCNNKIKTVRYSALLFIPKFLFDQFSKLANLFFLIVGILEQIPGVSPVGRYITLVPLFFILMVSAVKEIIEDFRRRVSDNQINSLPAEMFTNTWKTVEWKDLQVGNIIRVRADQVFPADVVLITTSDRSQSCYVQTASLDGETNYKMRCCCKQTRICSEEGYLHRMKARITCDPPNNILYQFWGKFQFEDLNEFPLGNDQIVLRGSVLKNTSWVIGVIVYTGHESKIMLNSSKPSIKRSSIDYTTNWLVLTLMAVLFVMTLVSASIYDVNLHETAFKHWYLKIDEKIQFTFHWSCITFFILFHNIIPISLSVTLEIVKMAQAYIISHDKDMYNETTKSFPIVKTSSIIEELGQINYIFTDKTGTLTSNEMVLRKLSAGRNIYNLTSNSVLSTQHALISNDPILFDLFIRNLLLCNAVIPELQLNSNEIIYQSSSPDETSIIMALSQQNFKFISRSVDIVTLNLNGSVEEWTVLNVIDFTSDRKRMSVIVKSPTGQIILFCKGADSVILERLKVKDDEIYQNTFNNLESFAQEGLRTLCIAYKYLTKEEYDSFSKAFNDATLELNDRQKFIDSASNSIENNLSLLGATGIEDKLQTSVCESIRILQEAKIRIWMLTGDKLETAMNIGYSCGLLTADTDIRIINSTSVESCKNTLKKIQSEFKIVSTSVGKFRKNPSSTLPLSLLVTGEDITFALDLACLEYFLDVAMSCRSVICCRISPVQKKNILLMIKENVADATTLAIGDGGNDCSMIQAAHVGIGIMGKEGMQAANTADFALTEFFHLPRLILVHGATSYQRICNCIYFCFYKNIVFNFMPFFYNFFNLFSGQIIFSKFSLALFNVAYTSAPPFCFGIIDRMCAPSSQLKLPISYTYLRNTYPFCVSRFLSYLMNGILHSTLVFFLCYLLCHNGVLTYDGHPISIALFGNIVFTHTLIVVTFKAALELRFWSWLSHVGIWSGFISYLISMTIFCRRFPLMLWLEPDFLDTDILMYQSPLFWFSLGIPLIVLFPDFIYHCVRNTFMTPYYILVAHWEQNKTVNWNEASTITKFNDKLNQSHEHRQALTKKYFGFAFSTTENSLISSAFFKRSAKRILSKKADADTSSNISSSP